MPVNQHSSVRTFFTRLAPDVILRLIFRQKYSAAMLILQISITLAVMSNGMFIVSERLQGIQHPSGVDENNLFVLTSSGFTPSFNPQTSMQTDLADLRAMPNVIDAVATYAFPYSGTATWGELQTIIGDNQNKIPAAEYRLDEHGIQALGLSLIAGENFKSNEVVWSGNENASQPFAILTANLAKNLFNTDDYSSIVGKTIYANNSQPTIIKGVVKRLQVPWDALGEMENSVIYPAVVTRNSARYIIRVKAGLLQTTMADVEHHLADSNNERMIRKVLSIQTMKKQVYGPDIAAIAILSVVVSALTIIAGMGIAGMATLNIQKRYRQIGVRRALGATRTDIMSYCLAENIIQTSLGIVIGVAISIGLNIFLVQQYSLASMPLNYLFFAVCFIYIIGILAVLKPTFNAIKIPPASATKNL